MNIQIPDIHLAVAQGLQNDLKIEDAIKILTEECVEIIVDCFNREYAETDQSPHEPSYYEWHTDFEFEPTQEQEDCIQAHLCECE